MTMDPKTAALDWLARLLKATEPSFAPQLALDEWLDLYGEMLRPETVMAARLLIEMHEAPDALKQIARVAFDGDRSGADRLDDIGVLACRAMGMTDPEICAFADGVMQERFAEECEA